MTDVSLLFSSVFYLQIMSSQEISMTTEMLIFLNFNTWASYTLTFHKTASPNKDSAQDIRQWRYTYGHTSH